jgi:hypothetical protein
MTRQRSLHFLALPDGKRNATIVGSGSRTRMDLRFANSGALLFRVCCVSWLSGNRHCARAPALPPIGHLCLKRAKHSAIPVAFTTDCAAFFVNFCVLTDGRLNEELTCQFKKCGYLHELSKTGSYRSVMTLAMGRFCCSAI